MPMKGETVTLTPGRVRDLGDDGLQAIVSRSEAVEEAHRIDDVARVAQMGE